jgi:integrase
MGRLDPSVGRNGRCLPGRPCQCAGRDEPRPTCRLISKAHEARALQNPTRSELVRATMRGIKRTRGCAQREARPLLRDDLLLVLDAMGDGLKDTRDRALLLIGFAGALRRSELVGLDVGDVEHVRQGIVLTLRRSKTDQDGQGRKIGIPFGRTRWCPSPRSTHGWPLLGSLRGRYSDLWIVMAGSTTPAFPVRPCRL